MHPRQQGFTIIIPLLIIAVLLVGVSLFVLARRPVPLSGIVPGIKQDLTTTYSNASVDVANWKAEHVTSLPRQVPGYDFAVSSASAPTLAFGLNTLQYPPQPKTITRYHFFKKEIMPARSDVELVSRTDAYLTKNKFTASPAKTSSVSFILNTTSVTVQVTSKEYKRGQSSCVLSTQETYVSRQISCFDSATWASVAATDKPFVQAYLQKNTGSTAKDITFGPLTIKSKNNSGVITASSKPGYDIAEAVVVDKGRKSLALYYQKDAVWHYITRASDEFGFHCADIFADPQARIALNGQICYDNSKGQIRVDSNRRALQ